MFRQRIALVALLFAAGCGGGGSGSGGSGSGGLPPVAPSTSPSVQAVGDVRTLTPAGIPHGAALTFDSDDGIALYDGDNPDGAYVYSTGASKYTYRCSSAITALYFSSTAHALYIACGTTIYEGTANGVATAVARGLQDVYSMTDDASGKLYIVDYDHVSLVQSGAATPITGSIFGLPSSDPQVSAQSPQIAFDSADGALYATDPVNDVVHRITTSGSVSTVAGKCYWYQVGGPGACFLSNVAGAGSAAVFGTPSGIAYDAASNMLYMSDAWNNNIWTISPSGAAVQVAGYGAYGQQDGNGFNALLAFPYLLAFDNRSGLLYMRTWAGPTQYVESYATAGTPAPAYSPPVQRFMLPTYTYGAGEMAVAPDGSAWTSEQLANKVAHISAAGSVQEYAIPAPWVGPWRMVVDSSGNAWAGVQNAQSAATDGAALVRIDSSGTATAFALAASPSGGDIVNALSVDDSGNVWFTKRNVYGGSVGYITPAGALNEFSVGSTFNAPKPQGLAQGPDGMMWFSYSSGTIGRVSSTGQFASPIASVAANVQRMVANPVQNNVWFTDEQTTVGTISATGAVSMFSGFDNDGAEAEPTQLAVDSSGYVWLSEANFGDVARVDAAGNITRYLMPQAGAGMEGVAARADGQVWAGSNMGAIFLLNPGAYAAARLPQASRTKPVR